MKKTRILSVALTLALVLSTVFAGTEGVFANTAVKAAAEDNTIKAVSMNSTETPQRYSIEYAKDTPNEAAISIPSAGTFAIACYSFTGATTLALYDSPDSNEPIDQVSTYATSTAQTWYVNVKKAGTYYLAFFTDGTSPCKASFDVSYAPKNISSPKLSKSYWAAETNGNYVYYKVKAPSTGYVTVDFPAGYDRNSSKYSVKLMNSKKSKNLLRSVETVSSEKGFKTYAAVAKGTYYVAVKTNNKVYQINLKFNKVSENSDSSRSKAKSISRGGKKRGTILATQTSSSADWYKIRVNSSQLVKLSFKTLTGGPSGGFRLSVYSGSESKAFGSADFYYGAPSDVMSLTTTINGYDTGRLQKGTYYIKVQKYGKGTGYYELKWL